MNKPREKVLLGMFYESETFLLGCLQIQLEVGKITVVKYRDAVSLL